jgi:hypothetical protein
MIGLSPGSTWIPRDLNAEARYLDNIFVIASYPRSGSHWTRRMMAEITRLRSGFESAAFGGPLNHISGFVAPFINQKDVSQWKTPFFVAAHDFEHYPEKSFRVYLRRRFEDVLRSTRKAEQELQNCWWGGTDEEVYEKWSRHIAKGCALADVVIDYEVTRTDPATTVKLIARLAGLELTRSELAAAVQAGRRENMLREQDACANRGWNVVNQENHHECHAY